MHCNYYAYYVWLKQGDQLCSLVNTVINFGFHNTGERFEYIIVERLLASQKQSNAAKLSAWNFVFLRKIFHWLYSKRRKK